VATDRVRDESDGSRWGAATSPTHVNPALFAGVVGDHGSARIAVKVGLTDGAVLRALTRLVTEVGGLRAQVEALRGEVDALATRGPRGADDAGCADVRSVGRRRDGRRGSPHGSGGSGCGRPTSGWNTRGTRPARRSGGRSSAGSRRWAPTRWPGTSPTPHGGSTRRRSANSALRPAGHGWQPESGRARGAPYRSLTGRQERVVSVLRTRRAREFARLQAAGWTVITVTPWDRLRTVRQGKAGQA
jgi:hypothetical protein